MLLGDIRGFGSRDKDGCTPNSVPMVYLLCSLGILGDCNP